MRTFLALLVMFALPLLMPVLPIPGLPGLLAGGLGGYLAGRPGRAALLALLPPIVLAVLVAGLGFGVGLPLLGSAIAGIALIWLLAEHAALLLGAVIGGAVAVRNRDRARAEEPPPNAPISVARPTDAALPARRAPSTLERTDRPSPPEML